MFICFRQNNSGGSYDIDDNLSPLVVVEGNDYDHCVERAEAIGIYFNGVNRGLDCECCGNRWYRGDEVLANIENCQEVPAMEYGGGIFGSEVSVIHYLDGRRYFRNFEPDYVE